jgi:hypothetical protein
MVCLSFVMLLYNVLFMIKYKFEFMDSYVIVAYSKNEARCV